MSVLIYLRCYARLERVHPSGREAVVLVAVAWENERRIIMRLDHPTDSSNVGVRNRQYKRPATMKRMSNIKPVKSTSLTKAAQNTTAPRENLMFVSDGPNMIRPAAYADNTLPD